MPIDPTVRFFFVHVQKTGGTSFMAHCRANFGAGEVYPDAEVDRERPFAAKCFTDYLAEVPAERLDRIRMFMVHMPFAVIDRMGLGDDVVPMTILRDPVDRAVSWLVQRHHGAEGVPETSFRGAALEEIYEQEALRRQFLTNHQVKQFAMTVDDPLFFLAPIEMDEERFEIARRNLARCALVGFQDDYDHFLDRLRHQWGWRIDEPQQRRVGQEMAVSADLRARIEADNPWERRFYEWARETYGR